MELEIITPDKKLLEGRVHLFRVPGSKGPFEVLQYHAPIISTLEKGQIKVEAESGVPQFFDIQGGLVEVQRNKAIILAEV